MNNNKLNELLLRLAQSEAATPLDSSHREEGLRRLRAGLRRLQEDPAEAQRIDDIVEAVEVDRDSYQMLCEALGRRDFEAAERCLRRAAGHGHDEAAYRLALLLQSREAELRRTGSPWDALEADGVAAEAREWHRQAAATGLAEALEAAGDTASDAEQTERHEQQATAPAGDPTSGNPAPASQACSEPGPGVASAQPWYAVGVELRPYRFVAVLIDELGRQLAAQQRELANMDVGTVVGSIRAAVESLLTTSLAAPIPRDRAALGLQLGAPVDTKTGTVHFFRKDPPHTARGRQFQWDEEELGPRLRRATGLKSVVENDANALATWERWFGVGRETDDFAVLLVREGVGASIVLGGRLFPGPVEIGNFITSYGDARMSDAGQLGALESVAGTTAIIAGVSQHAGFDVQDIDTAADLADEPDAGPRGLADPFTAAGVAIACAIGYLINFADPTHLVLYGPAVLTQEGRRAADAFVQQAGQFGDFVAFEAYRDCELVLRSLGQYDGALGAGLVALERCYALAPADLTDAESTR